MKRIFSLLIATACLFSSLTFGSVIHAADEATFNDVTSNTQYYEGIMTLSKLGIINGYKNDDGSYSFKPDGEITRAEFAKIIITSLGAGEGSSSSSGDFTDIDNHWAKGYITAAADRRIVNGMGDGTFAPDEKVTYEQAVKMIVCAAGYENAAVGLGGWPNGYILQAGNLGITKDAVSVNNTLPASRGIVAQLMFNVLDVEIPQYDINGNIKENLDTFMETYLGIVKEKATIVGVEDKVVASFTDRLYIDEMAIKLRDGSVVKMDYTTYVTDKSYIEDRLGYEAIVYYRKGRGGDMNSLYEIDFETSKNTITTISHEDIESYSAGMLQYYDDNDRLKAVTLNSSDLSVFYNGKIESSPDTLLSSLLDPNNTTGFMYGELKIVDGGADKTIDVVDIKDYTYIVVAKTPSTTDYRVSNKVKFTGTAPAKHLSEIELDPDSVTYTVSLTDTEGNSVSPTSLKVNNVLLVAQSTDGSIRNVIVCKGSVTGKITAKDSDGNITIGSTKYSISDYATRYFTDNGIKTDAAEQGTFYYDMYNSIVFGTQSAKTQSTSPYAYIIRATINEDEDAGTLTAYVPTANGVKTYTLAQKIKYNGTLTPLSDVVDDLRDNIPSDNVTNIAVPDNGTAVYEGEAPILSNAAQVARITLNGTVVEEINVAEPADYPSYPTITNKTTEDTSAILPYSNLEQLTYSTNNFGGKFYVNSSTVFIYVPQDRTENSAYAKRTLSSFKTGANYWVQPYNVSSSKFANLVLVYGTDVQATKVSDDDQAYILAADHSITASDDEQTYGVSYYANSTELKKKAASVDENKVAGQVSTTKDFSEINVGDFFRAATNSNSNLVNAQLLLDYDDVKAAIAGNCNFAGSAFTWSNSYIEVKVVNVISVNEDNGSYTITVTSDGFNSDGVLPDTNANLVTIQSDTIFYRLSADGSEVTPFIEGSASERISPSDLKEGLYDKTAASKIAIYSYRATTGVSKKAKMILIYE